MCAPRIGMGLRTKLAVRTILIAAWVLGVGVGIRALLRYANTPGALARPPIEWPANAPIKMARGRYTLAVFVHPQCPCSQATVEELAHIIACCRAQVETNVLVFSPSDAAPDWVHSDLWNSATRIPTVRVLEDRDASAARRFGAMTSGQVLLFDPQGHLAFNGGITAFRGHAGDNEGRDAIVALLRGETPRRRTTPVFGCALYGVTLSQWNPTTY